MTEKGKFIVLEGQGFSGKSEQMPLLVSKIEQYGIGVINTQEPGGVASALKIREEILAKRGKISALEEMELFYESRKRFLNELVIPSLIDGKWVLSTRFSASTFVYQGREGGVDLNEIRRLDKEVVGDNQPDLYILLDVEADEIFRRLNSKEARQAHSYNEKDLDKIQKRQMYYLELAHENQYNNWEIVDGNGSIDKVHKRIWQTVMKKFPERFKNL